MYSHVAIVSTRAMIISDTVHDFTNRFSYRLSYTCAGFTSLFHMKPCKLWYKKTVKNRSHNSICCSFAVTPSKIFDQFTRGNIATFYIVLNSPIMQHHGVTVNAN